MIIGLGTDIVSVERIAKLYDRTKEQMLERICCESEKKYVGNGQGAELRLAKLWAVKEAAVKALGTGFSAGVRFEDIELKHDALGKPEIEFRGKAKEILASKAMGAQINTLVSISDDKPFAQAVVIIEKI